MSACTRVESPFLRASRYYAPVIAEQAGGVEQRRAATDPERAATIAELASLADVVHMFRLRYGGMLLRALDAEIAVGNVRPTIRAARRELTAHYAGWCAAAVDPGAVAIPLQSLVAVQYGSVLATAAHLHDTR